jgi:hypothetical protein
MAEVPALYVTRMRQPARSRRNRSVFPTQQHPDRPARRIESIVLMSYRYRRQFTAPETPGLDRPCRGGVESSAAWRRSSSILKKRTKRPLRLRPRQAKGHSQYARDCIQSKSLLVLFFRKELLP